MQSGLNFLLQEAIEAGLLRGTGVLVGTGFSEPWGTGFSGFFTKEPLNPVPNGSLNPVPTGTPVPNNPQQSKKERELAMIYCVEDDDNIRELVVYTLESTGLEAKGFAEGRSFLEALAFDTPELVLLDIMLPGEDGMQILRRLKSSSKTKDIPVIMVTAKGTEYDKVIGLDSGADDYVTKPFGMMELVSRIKAVLRRTGRIKTDTSELEINGVKIDLKKHEVTADGKTIVLTLKEFELLEKLMKNQNIVLTRDQLLTDIWGYDFDGETRTVDVHIRTLRQKLGEYGSMIETIRGVGYRIGETNER